MLDVGDVIEIGGKEALVCFTANDQDEKYICVSFEEEEKIIFEIYKYMIENDKLMVSKVEDEEELKKMTAVFYEQSVEEFGIPEETKQGLLNFLNDNK
jgi:uncharacterized protein YpiB (UPF0302 family)